MLLFEIFCELQNMVELLFEILTTFSAATSFLTTVLLAICIMGSLSGMINAIVPDGAQGAGVFADPRSITDTAVSNIFVGMTVYSCHKLDEQVS